MKLVTHNTQPVAKCGLALCAVVVVLMCSHRLQAREPVITVTKMDGTQHNGKLTAWNAQGLTLTAPGNKTLAIAAKDLLKAEWAPVPSGTTTSNVFIEFVDGTRLPHSAYEVQNAQATIATTLATQPLQVSTKLIRFVQLAEGIPWDELAEQVTAGDVLMIHKKKTGSFDSLVGVLGSISEKQIGFTWDEEAISVKRSKVAALAYYRAKKPPSKPPLCWLNLYSGGRLPVAEIALKQDHVQVTTISNLTFSFPVDFIQEADFSHGKLAYLSNLQPIRQEWTPRIDLPASAELIRLHGMPRRDQSYNGSAMTLLWPATKPGALDGHLKTYRKGLSLRSKTEVLYRKPTGMRRFIALAGIDPETARQGNVTLEIFADQQSVWQGEIEGGAAPAEINISLGKTRELLIVVGYGTNLDFGDRLHLAEARFSQ